MSLVSSALAVNGTAVQATAKSAVCTTSTWSGLNMRCEQPVRSVDFLSVEEFQAAHLDACTPVVVRGAAKAWGAVSRWTPAYLDDAIGDLEVPLRRTPMNDAELSVSAVHQGFFPVRELLEQCSSDDEEEVYIPGIAMKNAPELIDDVERYGFLAGQNLRAISMFMGRNTRCLGHMHPFAQAVLTQVVGEKDVLLFSPSDLARVYMHPWTSTGFFQSRINFHALQADRFPQLADATPWRVRLQPGDALFIPVHWLHVPVGIGFSASVTHWWRSSPGQWGGLSAALRSVFGTIFSVVSQALTR